MTPRTLRTLLISGSLAVGMLLVSEADYRDAEREAAHYRDMVCSGHWPDYEQRRPRCAQERLSDAYMQRSDNVPPWDAYEPAPYGVQ